MTLRANLHMGCLAGLIALAAGAAQAKGPDAAQIFGEMDADGNGELTLDEMNAFAQARFDRVDTNGDGFLNSEELAAARAERRVERAARMVEEYDADASGGLDAEELAQMGQDRRSHFRERMHRGDRKHRGHRGHGRHRGHFGGGSMLERMDANDDGKLSLEEMTGRRDPARMLERLDADGNGSLSAEEFARMGERGKRRGERKPAE